MAPWFDNLWAGWERFGCLKHRRACRLDGNSLCSAEEVMASRNVSAGSLRPVFVFLPSDSYFMNDSFQQVVSSLNPDSPDYGPLLVNQILEHAVRSRATDIHLVPAEHGCRLAFRIDGVLQAVAEFDSQLGQRLVARLKVLAGLLTYRSDLPQEGRIRTGRLADVSGISDVPSLSSDVRIATFPTLFGEKAAVRLFSDPDQLQHLHELGLPEDIHERLKSQVQQTSGVILMTGPSGSGKTTTIYACLRELLRVHGTDRSLMTLEDPIEVIVPGVTQSQVKPESQFDLASGLKAMLRQDPDVIMVGEIRDSETAEQAFQAALTGHLVLTTFHAGSCAEAVTRLLDMGLEPYLLSSTLRSVVCQRLLRKRCSDCRESESGEMEFAENTNSENRIDKISVGNDPATADIVCANCGNFRYRGRIAMVEMMDMASAGMNRLVSANLDAEQRQEMAVEQGMITLQQRCHTAAEQGQTDLREVYRVLGRAM